MLADGAVYRAVGAGALHRLGDLAEGQQQTLSASTLLCRPAHRLLGPLALGDLQRDLDGTRHVAALTSNRVASNEPGPPVRGRGFHPLGLTGFDGSRDRAVRTRVTAPRPHLITGASYQFLTRKARRFTRGLVRP